MKTITLKASGTSKKVTIKEAVDGYGDIVYRARLTQDYNNGIEIEERHIATKEYVKQRSAISWGKRQLKN